MPKKAFIVTCLAAGDSGKGATVDFLTRQYKSDLVIRFNGGYQAAHNVITPDNIHHTFSQFSSGTFAGADTYLSEHVLIEPRAMMNEAKALIDKGIKEPFQRLYIDENAVVVTPFHILMNRIKETARDKAKHGSCGCGIGEAAYDKSKNISLQVKDLLDLGLTVEKLNYIFLKKDDELKKFLAEYPNADLNGFLELFYNENIITNTIKKYRDFVKVAKIRDKCFLATRINNRSESLIFEGSQGMLLDEKYGFAPHNTYSDITNKNAIRILNSVGFGGEIMRLGITRSYAHRHGAGPLMTYDNALNKTIKENHNTTNSWQGDFRVGNLDLVALNYAAEHAGRIDYLVMNHCDQIQQMNYVATGYDGINAPFYKDGFLRYFDQESQQTSLTIALERVTPEYEKITHDDLIKFTESSLGIPAAIIGNGPTAENREMLIKL